MGPYQTALGGSDGAGNILLPCFL